jgi:hypothetical protein
MYFFGLVTTTFRKTYISVDPETLFKFEIIAQ